jgi:hypothetical protein
MVLGMAVEDVCAHARRVPMPGGPMVVILVMVIVMVMVKFMVTVMVMVMVMVLESGG